MRALRRLLTVVVISSVTLANGVTSAEPEAAEVEARKPSKAPELEAAVRAMVNDRTLANARIGAVVMEVDSGEILAQYGEHTALNPASNAKLYTAAAALALLKGSHRYQTTLSGVANDGGVSGLVLRGNGDPSLETGHLYELARGLRAYGVRRVDGDLHVDHKFFDDQTTPPAFEQQPHEWAAFRAPVSAVALNANTITLSVRPTQPGSPAVAWFDPPGYVDVDGSVRTVEEGADNVILALSPVGSRLTAKLAGTIGADAKLVRYSRRAEDPRLLAGYALKAIFAESGIKMTGDVRLGSGGEGGRVLARRESEQLSTLLYPVGKNSDNFYAEMIFKSIAAEVRGRPAKSDEAAAIVQKFLADNDLDDEGVVVKNGSGLFDANRTTAWSVAKLLRHAWRDSSIQNEFVAHLAIGGVDGTLHKRFRNTRAKRAIRAKTGTLADAISLSGYVLGPPGTSPIAFALLFNGVEGRGYAARLAADKLVELIYQRQWR